MYANKCHHGVVEDCEKGVRMTTNTGTDKEKFLTSSHIKITYMLVAIEIFLQRRLVFENIFNVKNEILFAGLSTVIL